MTPVAKFSTSTSELRGKRARDLDRLRLLQVEDDAALRLAEHRVQLGGAAGIAAARRLDLDDFGAHRSEIARRRRAGDDPAEIEHANAGERHRPGAAVGQLPTARRDRQPERRRRAP